MSVSQHLTRRVRKLHKELGLPIVAVAIEPVGGGVGAHWQLAEGGWGEIEFAALALLTAAADGLSQDPGQCEVCDARRDRVIAAVAALKPGFTSQGHPVGGNC